MKAYKHCKTIAASGAGIELFETAGIMIKPIADARTGADNVDAQPGIIASREADIRSLAVEFVQAIAQHRHWERETAS